MENVLIYVICEVLWFQQERGPGVADMQQKIKLTWWQKIVLFVFCVLLNFIGKYIASKCNLPLWLDMQGTCVAAYFLGLPGGILVALLNNVLFAVYDKVALVYAITGMASAVLLWVLSRKGYLEQLRMAVFFGFWLGMYSMVISAPLNFWLYDGYCGNLWGDALVDMLKWYGFRQGFAALGGAFAVEILDKQICMILSYLLIRLINRILSETKDKKVSKAEGVVAGCLLVTLLTPFLYPVQPVCAAVEPEYEIQYRPRLYNNQNGMMSSEANIIEETEDGTIWIGSYAGLTSYDGTTFTFRKDSGIVSVTAMLCDSQGRLWIGTNDKGIARYEDGTFVYFDTSMGLPSDSIRCFYEDKEGNMYVGTTDRLCRIDSQDQIQIISEEPTYVLSIAGEGEVLACTDNNGDLYVLMDDKICADTQRAQRDVFYNCVVSTSRGLAVGTAEDGVYILDAGKNGISLKSHFDVPVQNIRAIEESEEGQIWLCGENGFGYLTVGGTYHAQETSDFHASFEDVHQDYQGNMWVASSRYGVCCLSRSPFFNLFTYAGAEKDVTNAVVWYHDRFYCGTDNGLVILDEKGNLHENELTGMLEGKRIRCLYTDSQKRLWICTYSDHGLVCSDGEQAICTYTNEQEPLVTSNRTRCITELSDGSMAVGTTDGIYFIREDAVTGNLTRQDGLENAQILSLMEQDGVLYAGSDGAGIFLISEGKITGNLTTEDGLSSNVILRMVPCAC